MSNIQVVVRCRERNENEKLLRSPVIIALGDDTYSADEPFVAVLNLSRESVAVPRLLFSSLQDISSYKTYKVDQICGFHASQRLMFEKVALPLFDDFYAGINTALLAYGQTGTGKTYTMCGDFSGSLDNAGIIPRVLVHLFDRLNKCGSDYLVKCSYLELYKEELRDLLVESDPDLNTRPIPLAIYESSNNLSNKGNSRGIHVQNLTETHVDSSKRALHLLSRGMQLRKTASTKLNDVSSRSHTIFTISLYKKMPVNQSSSKQDMFKVSKMSLVDLAGSENISRLGAVNQHAKEAGSINKSLLTLGRVISVLSGTNSSSGRPPSAASTSSNSSHIPYRESKLTRLLQDSIGGHTKTTLIATISPALSNMEETVSTLEYASKAKSIRNLPQAGGESSTILKKVLVRNLAAEAASLTRNLEAARSKSGVYLSEDNYHKLVTDNEAFTVSDVESKSKIEALESQLAIQAAESQNKQAQYEKQSNHQSTQIRALENQLRKHELESGSRIRTLQSQLDSTLRELASSALRAQSLEERLTRASGKFNASTTDYVSSTRERIEDCFLAINQLDTSISLVNTLLELRNASNDLLESNSAFLKTIGEELMLATTSLTTNMDNVLPKVFSQVERNISVLAKVIETFEKAAAHNLHDLDANNSRFAHFLKQKHWSEDSQRLMRQECKEKMELVMERLFQNFKQHSESHVNAIHDSYRQALDSQMDQQCVTMIASEQAKLDVNQANWEQSSRQNIESINGNIQQLVESAVPEITRQHQIDIETLKCRIHDSQCGWTTASNKMVKLTENENPVPNAAAQINALADSVFSRDERCIAHMNQVTQNLNSIKHLELRPMDSSPFRPADHQLPVSEPKFPRDSNHAKKQISFEQNQVPVSTTQDPLPSRSPARATRTYLSDIPASKIMAANNVQNGEPTLKSQLKPSSTPTGIPTLSKALSLNYSKENAHSPVQLMKKRRLWHQ